MTAKPGPVLALASAALLALAAGAPGAQAQEGSFQIGISTDTAAVSDSARAYLSGTGAPDAPSISDSSSALKALRSALSGAPSISDAARAYLSSVLASDAPQLSRQTVSGGAFNQGIQDSPSAFDTASAVIPASHTPVRAADTVAVLDSASQSAAAPPAQPAPRGGWRGSGTPVFGLSLHPGGAEGVYIRSASWDCGAGLFTVVAGPDAESIEVSLRMPVAGLVRMDRSGERSGDGVFTAPFGSAERYARISATLVSDRTISSDDEQVNIDSCAGTVAFSAPPAAAPAAQEPPAARQDAPAGPAGEAPAAQPAAQPAPPPAEPREQGVPDPPPPPAEPECGPGMFLDSDGMCSPAAQEPRPGTPECGPGMFLDSDGMCSPVQADGGGCLVATAAYGTETAAQVQRLREARDGPVASTGAGAAFLSAFNQIYYSFSPAVADLERSSPAFREAVRISLQPALWSLGVLEFAESGEQAALLGSLAVLFNAGLLASPAAAVLAYRRLARAGA